MIDGALLDDNAEVAALAGVECIERDLLIRLEVSDITPLASLRAAGSVMFEAPALAALDGLEQLEEVHNALLLGAYQPDQGCVGTQVSSLAPLASLQRVGALSICNNAALTSVAALSGALTGVGPTTKGTALARPADETRVVKTNSRRPTSSKKPSHWRTSAATSFPGRNAHLVMNGTRTTTLYLCETRPGLRCRAAGPRTSSTRGGEPQPKRPSVRSNSHASSWRRSARGTLVASFWRVRDLKNSSYMPSENGKGCIFIGIGLAWKAYGRKSFTGMMEGEASFRRSALAQSKHVPCDGYDNARMTGDYYRLLIGPDWAADATAVEAWLATRR